MRTHLITERVPPDDDRVLPPGHGPGNPLQDDRLAENGPAEDVANGPVRALPHLLQLELLHARLVGSDRRAFDADAVLLNRLCGLDGDLVIGLVTFVGE